MDTTSLVERMVDWVYARCGADVSSCTELAPFLEEHELDASLGYSVARDAESHGLAADVSAMSSPAVILTLEGVQLAQERQRQRRNPQLRAAAARTAVLLFLYEQDHLGHPMPVVAGVLDSEHGTYLGEPFTDGEVDRAGEYLLRRGLIDGHTPAETRGPVQALLTSDGHDCVEQHGGNVSEYLNQRDRGGTTFNVGSVHNTGAIAFVGNASQDITFGVDPAAMGAFVQTLLRELPALALDTEGQAGSRAALEDMQRELDSAAPDQGRVSAALERFAGYIGKAGQPVLTALLMAWARQHGMPS